MKIVDEKGKFLGKINIVDLLVILIVIAALIVLVVKFLVPRVSTQPNETTTLTYTALVGAVEPNIYEEILRQLEDAGGKDQLMANGKLVEGAYIVGVEAVPHVIFISDQDGNMKRSVEDFPGGRLDLTFTVQAEVEDPTVNKVGTQEVRVAKGHILKTAHIEFPYSTIMTCDWE